MVGWIPDGTVENDVMMIGGAWSIDQGYRIEGETWWRDEELSYRELSKMIEIYSVTKPRVMITHDCPSLAAYYLFLRTKKVNPLLYLTRTGEALQQMFEIHQPEEWYFGHWHHSVERTIEGTKFRCLGIDELTDVEF